MKRFEFSLEKMLSYKDQLLSGEKQRLSELREKLRMLCEALALLREEYRRCNAELNERVQKGLAPQQISQRKAYLNAVNEKIKLQAQHVRLMEIKVSEQLGLVVRISQDINTLEKLKERQYEEYRAAESKEMQELIEEFVSNSSLTH